MRRSALVFCLILTSALVSAQRATLTEMVRQAQNDVSVTISANSPAPVPFEQLVARTDHVVRATVGPATSYITDNGYEIATTFALAKPQVVFSKKLFQSPTVGAEAPPLTYTQRGGTVRVGAFRASVVESGSVPKVTEGMDVILFLRDYNGKQIATGPDGIFEVRDSKVFPLDEGPGEHHGFAGMSSQSFLEHIVAERNRLRPK